MIQQYLVFTINETRYAINVFKIQEVLEYEEPQKIPCSNPLLIGIIRSRDTNIAIMDIRKKFELSQRIPGKETRTIVLEVTDAKSGVINLYGIIADSVLEVIEIDDSKLESLPKENSFAGNQFVTNLFSKDDIYTLVLDVTKLFSEQERSTQNTETDVQIKNPENNSETKTTENEQNSNFDTTTTEKPKKSRKTSSKQKNQKEK